MRVFCFLFSCAVPCGWMLRIQCGVSSPRTVTSKMIVCWISGLADRGAFTRVLCGRPVGGSVLCIAGEFVDRTRVNSAGTRRAWRELLSSPVVTLPLLNPCVTCRGICSTRTGGFFAVVRKMKHRLTKHAQNARY